LDVDQLILRTHVLYTSTKSHAIGVVSINFSVPLLLWLSGEHLHWRTGRCTVSL